MSHFPLVSFIIVNYNGAHLLKDCLASLYALEYPQEKIEVIVVDNGSKDSSYELVTVSFPRAKFIRNEVNNYCKGNNLGIKKAHGDFIALVNNDAILNNLWLQEIIPLVRQDKTVGAASGKVLFPDGKVQSAGHTELANFYWVDRGFREKDTGQYNAIEEVASISHCASVFRKECLERVGLLDEDFHMYLEDVDMSLRARAKGWKLLYVPGSIAVHKFHGSIDDASSNFLCERNRLLLIAKHFPDKLPGALSGQQYFTELRSNRGIMEVLPVVFEKVAKHHGQVKMRQLLTQVCESAGRIMQLERDSLHEEHDLEKKHFEASRVKNDVEISRLTEQIALLQERNKNLEKDIALMNEQRIETKRRMEEAQAEIARFNERVVRLENDIAHQERQMAAAAEKLSLQEKLLNDARKEIGSLNEHIAQIYDSETYRFIAKPLWILLDRIKGVRVASSKRESGRRVLLIKPFCVKAEETLNAVRYVRTANPAADEVSLFANVAADGYQLLLDNGEVKKKFIFSSGINQLTIPAFLKALFLIRQERYDEAIVLIGDPAYHGYRKAKLFAFLSGAKKKTHYFLRSSCAEPAPSRTPFSLMCKAVYGNIVLSVVLVLFVVCVVVPLRLKRFFQR